MLRIATVSYLNSRPLIEGLDQLPERALLRDVPAKLLDLLREGRADVALLPVIDYQRMDNLCIVPSGGIGSEGETLTVRIFSRTPIEQITALACDTDSHTSVALARIILAEQFGISPEFAELSKSSPQSARLLIGDKVVCEEPTGFPYQLDLGAAWKKLTGLPFVFAVWTARMGINLENLPEQLTEARERGLANVHDLVERFAIPLGWPPALALQYLTKNLKFEIGEPQFAAIRQFHQLLAKHGIIEQVRDLKVYEARYSG